MARGQIPHERIEIARINELYKKVRIIFVMLLSLLLIGTFSFMILTKENFINSFLLTLETFAFAKELDTGFLRFIELTLMVFGVFFLWWLLWTLFDLLIEGTITDLIKDIKFFKILKNMENHYLICGGGRVGEYLGDIFKENKRQYVILENDEKRVEELRKKGHPAVVCDAMEEDGLIENGIKKACALIAVLPETEKNILITLTARQSCPKLVIYARAHKKSFIPRLKSAGATYTIVPEMAGAEKIAQQIFK
jgi:voltage-gated potassium channel